MKKGKKLLVGLAALSSVISLASCNMPWDKKEPKDEDQKQESQVSIVSISATMTKTTYVEGDLLSLAGLKVTANYSDNTSKEITGYTTNHEEGYELQLGDKLVVTLGGKSCEINLTITEKNVVLQSITLSVDKTEYFEGEKLGTVTVKGTYSNGTEQTIAGGYNIVINDQNVAANHVMAMGENGVKVTYEGLTSNQVALTVKEDVVTSIAVSEKFRQFAPGEEFIKETVTATYASGKTATVEAQFTGYDMANPGVQTITVTYGSLTPITYQIEVDEKYDTRVVVVISAAETQVERTQNVTISLATIKNAVAADVSYTVVSGPATISSAGVVQVNVDAVVGSKIKIKATAKGVDSNELELTVKDTLPTKVELKAEKHILKDGETIALTPKFTPEHATKTDVVYNLKGDAKDSVEIVNGELKFKQGSTMYDDMCKTVTVEATIDGVASVTTTTEFIIGFAELFLTVDTIEIIVPLNEGDIYVNATAEGDDEDFDIDKSKLKFYSQNEDVVTVDEHTGKVTVKGCGTATIEVKLNDISSTGKCTVVIPPEEVVVNGFKQAALDRGFKTGKDQFIELPFLSTRNDSYTFSEKLDYTFKLYDKKGGSLISEVQDDIVEFDTTNSNKFKFKQTGFVEVTAKSNSTIGNVEAGAYERNAVAEYVVNEGVNIYDLPHLHFALYDKEVKGVNLMNDIYFEMLENIDVEGLGTYSSYEMRDNNVFLHGLISRGDKDFEGNGYKLSLEKLPLPVIDNEEGLSSGDDLLDFYAACYEHEAPENEDVIGTPYKVEIRDFTLIGQNDFNRNYLGSVESERGKKVHLGAKGAFAQTFRRGIRIGGSNARAGFVTYDGKYEATGYRRRDYQKCANAYVESPVVENLTIQGFETGLRSEHVVDGHYEGLNISDCYNNATEVNQCIVEYHNTTINQVGGFAIEVVPDGMDMANLFQGGQLGINYKQAGRKYFESVNGVLQGELPDVRMTGDINCHNMNSGNSTERMANRALGEYTVPRILEKAIEADIEEIAATLGGTYARLDSEADIDAAKAYVNSRLVNIAMNASGELDFFCLMFLYEYNAVLKAQHLVIKAEEIVNFHCDKNSAGDEADSVSILEIIENLLKEYATEGTHKYDEYKKYKYITIDLDGKYVEGLAANMGAIVLTNLGYDPNFVSDVQ